jgi:hypothetical protein
VPIILAILLVFSQRAQSWNICMDHRNLVVVVLCYWSVDKMVSYLIGGVMVSILALSVLDPWDRALVWSNQRL